MHETYISSFFCCCFVWLINDCSFQSDQRVRNRRKRLCQNLVFQCQMIPQICWFLFSSRRTRLNAHFWNNSNSIYKAIFFSAGLLNEFLREADAALLSKSRINYNFFIEFNSFFIFLSLARFFLCSSSQAIFSDYSISRR